MLSKHFKRSEFKCPCCDFSTVDVELLEVLEDLRVFFEKPVIITSGCRCDVHNADVGGSIGSKHMYGIAADIVIRDIPPDDVYIYLDNKYNDKYGIGLYSSWVHIDIRADKARW